MKWHLSKKSCLKGLPAHHNVCTLQKPGNFASSEIVIGCSSFLVFLCGGLLIIRKSSGSRSLIRSMMAECIFLLLLFEACGVMHHRFAWLFSGGTIQAPIYDKAIPVAIAFEGIELNSLVCGFACYNNTAFFVWP